MKKLKKVTQALIVGLFFWALITALSSEAGIKKQDGDDLSYVPLLAFDFIETALVFNQVNKIQAARTVYETEAAQRGVYCQCDKPGLNECFSYKIVDCVKAGLAEKPVWEFGAGEDYD